MELRSVIGYYREYAPREDLRPYVRSVFSFAPGTPPASPMRHVRREILLRSGDRFCSPVFADGNGSMVLELGTACHEQSGWRTTGRTQSRVIGPMTGVGETKGWERPEMLGVYFRAAGLSRLLGVPASELTDLVVSLGDVWGARGALADDLVDLDELARIERVEAELARGHAGKSGHVAHNIDLAALAAWISESRGGRSVEQLADAAGVSRQHLTRLFRARIGVTPKLYSRLARFQSGLAFSGEGASVRWSCVAADLGYADQSHMIAEFRAFSSLTPQQLGARRWFHPFIERAKSRFRLARTTS